MRMRTKTDQPANGSCVGVRFAAFFCLFPKGQSFEGLWELESGMDVTYGEGRTLLEFKSNGEIEISAELPPDPEDETASGYEIIRYPPLRSV